MHPLKIVAMAGALLSIAASSENVQRKFVISDDTVADPDMSTPISSHVAPVPCSNENVYIAVKCSSAPDSAYQAVGDSSLTLVCPKNSAGIAWRDNSNFDNRGTINWQCSLNVVRRTLDAKASRSWQEATISGTLSLCEADSITTQNRVWLRVERSEQQLTPWS